MFVGILDVFLAHYLLALDNCGAMPGLRYSDRGRRAFPCRLLGREKTFPAGPRKFPAGKCEI
jgi:hypothetical protein